MTVKPRPIKQDWKCEEPGCSARGKYLPAYREHVEAFHPLPDSWLDKLLDFLFNRGK